MTLHEQHHRHRYRVQTRGRERRRASRSLRSRRLLANLSPATKKSSARSLEDFGRFVPLDVEYRLYQLRLATPLALLPALQQPKQCGARQNDKARGRFGHRCQGQAIDGQKRDSILLIDGVIDLDRQQNVFPFEFRKPRWNRRVNQEVFAVEISQAVIDAVQLEAVEARGALCRITPPGGTSMLIPIASEMSGKFG